MIVADVQVSMFTGATHGASASVGSLSVRFLSTAEHAHLYRGDVAVM